MIAALPAWRTKWAPLTIPWSSWDSLPRGELALPLGGFRAIEAAADLAVEVPGAGLVVLHLDPSFLSVHLV